MNDMRLVLEKSWTNIRPQIPMTAPSMAGLFLEIANGNAERARAMLPHPKTVTTNKERDYWFRVASHLSVVIEEERGGLRGVGT